MFKLKAPEGWRTPKAGAKFDLAFANARRILTAGLTK
jgi:hypothetical protein